jgi:hypothetical protein
MANTKVTNLYPTVNTSVSSMEMLTVNLDGTVTEFATTYHKDTKYVTIDVQDANVYVTFTGETPSATVGHILYAERSYTWNKNTAQVAKFKCVSTSTSAVLAASEFTD